MTSVQEFFKNVVLGYPFFHKIREIIDSNPNTNFELEARINKIRHISNPDDYNETGWDLEAFNRLKNFLMNFGEPIEQHMTDYTRKSDNLRQTIKQNLDGSETIYNINKISLFTPKDSNYNIILDLRNNYGIKMGLSKETKEIPTKELIKNYDVMRVKHRYSWLLDNFNVRFDLTQVIQTINGVNKDKYEIELEMIAPQLQERKTKLSPDEAKNFAIIYKKFSGFVEEVSKILHDSDNFYSRPMITTLSSYINNKLDAQSYITRKRNLLARLYARNPDFKPKIDYPNDVHVSNELIVQARQLKSNDLNDTGLMFGKIRYTVTPKAEGKRKFLVVHDTGVWLFNNSQDKTNFCLVYKSTDKEFEDWKKYNGTILDGEDIPPDNEEHFRKGNYQDIKHYYLPFDTLFFRGKDVRSDNLKERQTYISIIKTIGNTEKLLIEEKPFYELGPTLETMYQAIQKCLNQNSFSYETDGLIFTPINTIYNPQNDIYSDRYRELPEHPEITKWKPLEKTSMDVQIEININHRKIYSSKGDKIEEFKGNDRNPFDPETQIDFLHPLFKKIKNGDIVELAPKFVEGKLYKNEEDKIVLIPLRIRYDKTYANGIGTVNNTWKEMNDPIKIETLLGSDDTLLRQYHNKIKYDLYTNIKGDQRTGSHLIDIGSGRGGDLGKYRGGKFTKILSIEPHEPYYNEFLERLESSFKDLKPLVTTLLAGGEESQRILQTVKDTFGNELGKAPLTISMMLSLSFFWLNGSAMLYQLANTINLIKEAYYSNGGKTGNLRFIFLTIEGERTYNLMTANNNFVDLNGTTLSYFPEKETVHIHIPDSIVTEQDEGLVNLYQLRNLTNMDVVYEKEATENKMLSEPEKILTSLYVYGEYVVNNSSFILYPKDNLKNTVKKIIDAETFEEPEVPVKKLPFPKSSRSRSVSPVKTPVPEYETVFDKLEQLELPVPEELKNYPEDNSKEKEETLKISIKTGYVDDEGYYVPSESNSTLFECIIKYFNPEAPYVPMNEVIKYRNEMALSIRNTNPFDNANRSIFVSAGKGFLKDVSVNKPDAVSWIASDNELPPPYLVWIPDTIGVNLQVNGEKYLTTRLSNEVETIVLKYEDKHYRVKV